MRIFTHLREKFVQAPRIEKILIVSSTIFLIGFSVWAGYQIGYQKPRVKSEPKKTTAVIPKPVEEKVANPINGILYSKTEAAQILNRLPIGVMIENSILARPQRGLSKADIVYEALAEGDITRFLAIYLSQTSQIGPIRSARGYYLDWISEYQAGYAHWGGNQGVRALSTQYFGKKNLDQFEIGSPTFYRIPPGGGEHTGHSTIDKLWEAATKRGVNNPVVFDSWKFKDDKPLNPPTHPTVNIGFKGNYAVRWDYDPATNSYKRFNGGVAHMDKEYNVQITVKEIIVEFMQDNGYKKVTGVSNRDFTTIGSGTAKIFQDGTIIEGSWKKDSREGRTKFFDSVGNEVLLNRGQIWMEMVPNGTPV